MSDDWREERYPSRRVVTKSRQPARASAATATAATTSNPPITTTSPTLSPGVQVSATSIQQEVAVTHANVSDKQSLVENARLEREERARKRHLETCVVTMQAFSRRVIARKRQAHELKDELQRKLQDIDKIETVLKQAKKQFVLPAVASVRLTRCAWMLGRLTNSFQLSTEKAHAKSLLTKLGQQVARTISSKTYETIWDDGCRVRTACLVYHELSTYISPCVLTISMVQSHFFFVWINLFMAKNETIVRERLVKSDLALQQELVYTLTECEERLQKQQDRDLDAIPNYYLLLYSVPCLFARLSSQELLSKLTQDQHWEAGILRVLSTSLSKLNDNEQVLAIAGNVFSFLVKLPRVILEKDSTFKALHLLISRLPRFTFVGTEGVAWDKASGRVSRVDPKVLLQLDLAHVVVGMTETALRVDAIPNGYRLEKDQKEWENILSTNSPFSEAQAIFKASSSASSARASGSSNRPSSKSLLSIMSASSWAKKLGWSSSAKHTDVVDNSVFGEEDAHVSLLMKNQSEESRKLAATRSLFLNPDRLAVFLKALTVYFLKWPAKAANPKSLSVLNSLSFSFPYVVDRIWAFAESQYESRSRLRPELEDNFWASSFIFSIVACHFLLVTDETELYERSTPMNRAALERCVFKLNEVLYSLDLTALSSSQSGGQVDAANSLGDEFARAYVSRSVRFLTQLRDLHSRRALTQEKVWFADKNATVPSATTSSSTSFFRSLLPVSMGGRNDTGQLSAQEQVYFAHHLYWCLPFHRRAKWFSDLIANERTVHQPPDEPPTYKLQVRRRNAGLDDALPFFLRSDLRKRVYVIFLNEFGLPEAGIDSRGLFKEFIQTLAENVFDPKRGLFAMTEDGDRCLFPNPKASLHMGSSSHETLRMFQFAGKLLGKALFEGIVIQPEFSFFILAKLLRKLVTISDLASLDQELFKNLLFLKNTKLDVKDLCLTFSVTSSTTGRETELFPGGSMVEVTTLNKYKYVNSVAHYRLNSECKEEHEAFVSGFHSVIQHEWIAPFSERELQTLISGQGGKINVADLKQNCVYGGGYFSGSQHISWFWEIVERDMNDADRSALLRFATACTRAPLLGFAHLEPKFQIQRVMMDDMQLPSASTCFNILKLPPYPTKAILKEKLFKAIHSGAGFDLT